MSNDETKLAFQLDSDRGPNNLYVFAFGSDAPRRLTDTMTKAIDPADLVDAQVVRFPSFDGMAIPNIFYKPLAGVAPGQGSGGHLGPRRARRPDAAAVQPATSSTS